MKSYLITWDEEDAVSSFRCWVSHNASFVCVVGFGCGVWVGLLCQVSNAG